MESNHELHASSPYFVAAVAGAASDGTPFPPPPLEFFVTYLSVEPFACAVTSRPFVRDFRCEENTPGAAAIVVEPDGKLTPPFTCAFNQVPPSPLRPSTYQPLSIHASNNPILLTRSHQIHQQDTTHHAQQCMLPTTAAASQIHVNAPTKSTFLCPPPSSGARGSPAARCRR